MPPVEAILHPATTDRLPRKYAGIGRRLAALLIDNLICLAAVFLAAMVVRALRVAGLFPPVYDASSVWDRFGPLQKTAVLLAFFVSTGAIYVPLCQSSAARATMGQWAAAIHVATRSGARLSFSRALWRWFVLVILNLFVIGLASVITIQAASRGRALHDFAAATVVEVNLVTGQRPRLEWWRVAFGIAAQTIWIVVTFWIVLSVSCM